MTRSRTEILIAIAIVAFVVYLATRAPELAQQPGDAPAPPALGGPDAPGPVAALDYAGDVAPDERDVMLDDSPFFVVGPDSDTHGDTERRALESWRRDFLRQVYLPASRVKLSDISKDVWRLAFNLLAGTLDRSKCVPTDSYAKAIKATEDMSVLVTIATAIMTAMEVLVSVIATFLNPAAGVVAGAAMTFIGTQWNESKGWLFDLSKVDDITAAAGKEQVNFWLRYPGNAGDDPLFSTFISEEWASWRENPRHLINYGLHSAIDWPNYVRPTIIAHDDQTPDWRWALDPLGALISSQTALPEWNTNPVDTTRMARTTPWHSDVLDGVIVGRDENLNAGGANLRSRLFLMTYAGGVGTYVLPWLSKELGYDAANPLPLRQRINLRAQVYRALDALGCVLVPAVTQEQIPYAKTTRDLWFYTSPVMGPLYGSIFPPTSEDMRPPSLAGEVRDYHGEIDYRFIGETKGGAAGLTFQDVLDKIEQTRVANELAAEIKVGNAPPKIGAALVDPLFALGAAQGAAQLWAAEAAAATDTKAATSGATVTIPSDTTAFYQSQTHAELVALTAAPTVSLVAPQSIADEPPPPVGIMPSLYGLDDVIGAQLGAVGAYDALATDVGASGFAAATTTIGDKVATPGAATGGIKHKTRPSSTSSATPAIPSSPPSSAAISVAAGAVAPTVSIPTAAAPPPALIATVATVHPLFTDISAWMDR